MNPPVEVKYRKFEIGAGERLVDLPAFQRWEAAGWRVAWSYWKVEGDAQYVETLLQRSLDLQAKTEEVRDL